MRDRSQTLKVGHVTVKADAPLSVMPAALEHPATIGNPRTDGVPCLPPVLEQWYLQSHTLSTL